MLSVNPETSRLFETTLADGQVIEAFFDGIRAVVAPGHVPNREFSQRADELLVGLGIEHHSSTDRVIHRWAVLSTDTDRALCLMWNDPDDDWNPVGEHTPGAVPISVTEVVVVD